MWMTFLPVVGPVRSMQLRWDGDIDAFRDLTEEQRLALEPIGEVTFDEHRNIITRHEPDYGTFTYVIQDGLRVSGHNLYPDGTESTGTYTYREFTEDGRLKEFAVDVFGEESRIRRVYDLYYGNRNYWTSIRYDYLADGTRQNRNRETFYGCAYDTLVDDSSDTEYYFTFKYYLDGESRPPTDSEFGLLWITKYEQPLNADIPLFERERSDWTVGAPERDHRGNPTVFIVAHRIPQFDEWAVLGAWMVYVTYEYY